MKKCECINNTSAPWLVKGAIYLYKEDHTLCYPYEIYFPTEEQNQFLGYCDSSDFLKIFAPLEDTAPKEPATKQCAHSWKTYVGFMDKFDYCEKCDIKRT